MRFNLIKSLVKVFRVWRNKEVLKMKCNKRNRNIRYAIFRDSNLKKIKWPSWHRDVVTTLWQRRDTVENESCDDVGLRRWDNVAVPRCQDVDTTLLQRHRNIKHLVSRPFYLYFVLQSNIFLYFLYEMSHFFENGSKAFRSYILSKSP